jgi:hypothetical protein
MMKTMFGLVCVIGFCAAIFSSFYSADKFDLIQTAAISCLVVAQFIRRDSYDSVSASSVAERPCELSPAFQNRAKLNRRSRG